MFATFISYKFQNLHTALKSSSLITSYNTSSHIYPSQRSIPLKKCQKSYLSSDSWRNSRAKRRPLASVNSPNSPVGCIYAPSCIQSIVPTSQLPQVASFKSLSQMFATFISYKNQNLHTADPEMMKGLLGLSKCEWVTYSRTIRVEIVPPPGIEPATNKSKNRHAHHSATAPQFHSELQIFLLFSLVCLQQLLSVFWPLALANGFHLPVIFTRPILTLFI